MKQSKPGYRLIAAILGITLGAPAAVLASTPSHVETSSISVSYADLRIESSEGAAALYRRLQRATKKVCGEASPKHVGRVVRQTDQCYRETLTEAVKKVDNDHLTRIHAG